MDAVCLHAALLAEQLLHRVLQQVVVAVELKENILGDPKYPKFNWFITKIIEMI